MTLMLLQAVVDASHQRLTTLNDQWERIRGPLEEEYRSLQMLGETQMVSSRCSHVQCDHTEMHPGNLIASVHVCFTLSLWNKYDILAEVVPEFSS